MPDWKRTLIRIWKSKYSKNNSHARTGAGIFVLRRFKMNIKNKDNNNESQNLKENFYGSTHKSYVI